MKTIEPSIPALVFSLVGLLFFASFNGQVLALGEFVGDCPLADGFDFPVGPPDAKGYYNAQPFGTNTHLGEDWNGKGGGNSDLGDPVFSAANGVVTYAADGGPGWGNVVRILHNIGTKAVPII